MSGGNESPDSRETRRNTGGRLPRHLGRLLRPDSESNQGQSLERLRLVLPKTQGLTRTALQIIEGASQIPIAENSGSGREGIARPGSWGYEGWMVEVVKGGMGIDPRPPKDKTEVPDRFVWELPDYWLDGLDLKVKSVRLYAFPEDKHTVASEVLITFFSDANTDEAWPRSLGVPILPEGRPKSFLVNRQGQMSEFIPNDIQVGDFERFLQGTNAAIQTTVLSSHTF